MAYVRIWKEGDAAEAVRNFFAQAAPRRTAIRDLMTALLSPTPFDRRCAADLARRVSAREPGILKRYAPVLIDLIAELPPEEWQARGYVALAAALNASTHSERQRLAVLARRLAVDERIAVRAMGLEAFAVVAAAEADLRDEAVMLLERSRHDASAAMRSRARRMLPVVMAAELKLTR